MDNSYIYFWRIVMLSLAFSLVAMSSNMGFKETALITLLGIVGSTLTTLFIQRKSQLNKINEHLAKVTEKLGDEDVRSISKQIGLEGNYEPLGLQIKDVKKKQSDNKEFLSEEHRQILSKISEDSGKLGKIRQIVEAEAEARKKSEEKQELRLAGMNTSQKNVLEAVQKVPDLIKLYEHEIDRNIDLTNNIENLQNECSEMQKEYEELKSKHANLMHICSKLQQENKRLSQEISNMKQQMNRKPSRDIEPLQP